MGCIVKALHFSSGATLL